MKTSTKALLAFAVLLVAGMTVATPSVKAGTAPAPVWNEGDGWAVGKNVDLDVEFAQAIQNATDVIQNTLNHTGIVRNFTLMSFKLEASGAAWLLFKVVSANATEYHLRAVAAVKFTASLDAKASYEFPRAGTYDYSSPPASSSWEEHTATGALKVDMASILEANLFLQKDNAAIKKVTADFKGSLSVKVDATNVPDFTRNETLNTITVRYVDYHFTGKIDLSASAAITFLPALNLYDFPISVGDEWDIDSNATLTGNVAGTVDVTGLPETGLLSGFDETFFESEALQDAGITSFPIDLTKLMEHEEDPTIHNGVLGPETSRIQHHMKCTSSKVVDLPNLGETEIWAIEMDGEPTLAWASNMRFWTSLQTVSEETDLPFDMPELPEDVPGDMTDMPEVSVSEAEQEISEISDYQAQISGSGGSSGLNLDMMMILLVVAVVAVVAVILVFVLMKRKPKVQ